MDIHPAVSIASCLGAGLAALLLVPAVGRFVPHPRWLGSTVLAYVVLAWAPLAARMAGQAELAALIAGGALLVAAPMRDVRGPAAIVGGWLIAAATLVALGTGVDLASMRGGPVNALLTVGFLAAVAVGVEGLRAQGPHRASGALAIIAVLLSAYASHSGQTRVFGALLPLAGALVGLHLLIIPPDPERIEVSEALPGIALLLAWATLELRFSDRSPLGALAAPLIWSTPALIAVLLVTWRRVPSDPETFVFTAVGGACALSTTLGGGVTRMGIAFSLLSLLGVILVADPLDAPPPESDDE